MSSWSTPQILNGLSELFVNFHSTHCKCSHYTFGSANRCPPVRASTPSHTPSLRRVFAFVCSKWTDMDNFSSRRYSFFTYRLFFLLTRRVFFHLVQQRKYLVLRLAAGTIGH